jgi:hypothetical protein
MTFDGANYADFAAHMRVHMRGLWLWGVLCGEVPSPPHPLVPVAPVPPMLPVLAADASEADRVAAKTADDAAVDAYDQQVADFSAALSTYRDAQTAYTQWCDEDARAVAALTASVCNNPNFWEIKINEFIKIPNFGDNKNFYFKYKINFLSFRNWEFEHLLPCFK